MPSEFSAEVLGEYDPTLDLSSYKLPVLDLLEHYSNKNTQSREELKAELENNKNRIVETLGHYNIAIDKIKATVGPTVTLFEIIPQAGIRISKIKNLEDDIALSLAALGIRIIAPIPGKGTIGIEVPNQNPETVSMRSVVASDKFQGSEYDLPIALGKTISNEVFVADLAKMPHLLMAGATGQGKSVGLNAVLVSLLYKKHPSQVKFVLVDPKKVELTLFKRIERHFLAKLPGEEEAIITDTRKVINTLNSLCIEMDQRYELLKEAQVRNIREYNAKFVARKLNPNKGHRFLPFIVLVVDEFADLIMTAGKEIETPIGRLAQLARAIGIHLIIATQRPSVNIITGTIKANFPARLAFRVSSKVDSRTILDTGGAEQLIGRGDMLLSQGADIIRLQCAFVDTPEVEKITDFIGEQKGYAEAFQLPEYVGDNESGSSEYDPTDRDPLFEEAARMIVQHQQGSASLLQRRLKLGYNRAGRLIDQLEAAGIIGPFEGSKAREVKVKDPMALEQFLNDDNKE
jgi:S-DNA-T family DNA segregation ATPase FtsK/SpoIIIE